MLIQLSSLVMNEPPGSATLFITATETLLMENEVGSQWYLVVMGSSLLVPLAINIVGAQSQVGMKL